MKGDIRLKLVGRNEKSKRKRIKRERKRRGKETIRPERNLSVSYSQGSLY